MNKEKNCSQEINLLMNLSVLFLEDRYSHQNFFGHYLKYLCSAKLFQNLKPKMTSRDGILKKNMIKNYVCLLYRMCQVQDQQGGIHFLKSSIVKWKRQLPVKKDFSRSDKPQERPKRTKITFILLFLFRHPKLLLCDDSYLLWINESVSATQFLL